MLGSLDLVILGLLERGEMYGYQISRILKGASGDVLAVGEGTLYPVLHRLEMSGHLRARWDRGSAGRRTRYYALTRSGEKELERRRDRWERLTVAVNRLLEDPA